MSLNLDVLQTYFATPQHCSMSYWGLLRFLQPQETDNLPTFHKIHAQNARIYGTVKSPLSLFFSDFFLFWACNPVWDVQCCCCLFSSCLPTQVSVHLLGYAWMSEEYIVCVYTVQLVRELQEQTDRSSLHSGARGKPLIKQRDRNWPSWWYNPYTHIQSARTHVQMHLHTIKPPPSKMHECRHEQTANACTYTFLHAHIHRRKSTLMRVCPQARNN